jgi:hypothetical protein
MLVLSLPDIMHEMNPHETIGFDELLNSVLRCFLRRGSIV